MKPIILFRSWNEESEYEKSIAEKYFEVHSYRSTIDPFSLVIGRYSVLPYYQELEKELKINETHLINSYDSHRFICNMEWAKNPKIKTPKTWFLGDPFFTYNNLPQDKSFIVKGRTNSRKHQWNSRMFAKNVLKVPDVVGSLLQDELIKDQGIVVREYVSLKKFEEGINGLPITNEWRCFFLNGKPVASGYYWSHAEKAEEYNTNLDHKYFNLKGILLALDTAQKLLKYNVNFACIDVAQKEDGEWIVIEVNDGQMSGLSMIDPEIFYRNLKNIVERDI